MGLVRGRIRVLVRGRSIKGIIERGASEHTGLVVISEGDNRACHGHYRVETIVVYGTFPVDYSHRSAG